MVNPVGGESWYVGLAYQIIWFSEGVSTVDIDYSADYGATWNPIASGVDASLSFHVWTMPDDPTNQAVVRLTDADNPAVTAASGAFTILIPEPSVRVISPNGLQEWEVGAERRILFETTMVTEVSIELSCDAGETWSTIVAAALTDSSSYLWTVPDLPGDACLIRVSDTGGSGLTDDSDETFSIVPPLVRGALDYEIYRDSPAPLYYGPSWSYEESPSTLVQIVGKVPVSTERSLVGNYALSLEWTSEADGDWGASIACVDYREHDLTQRDSLVIRVFSEEPTPQAELPCLYLEDLSGHQSNRRPLANWMGDVTTGVWQRVAIPLDYFQANPWPANIRRIQAVGFGQQAADGIPHQWYLDDVRVTGNLVTGEEVPLIVVLGSSTAVGSGASHPDSGWVGRYRDHVVSQCDSARVVNLAIGGNTTYHILPTGWDPPPVRPHPRTEHNITWALLYQPWAIVVNLPSNDVIVGHTIEEQLANYDVVTALADSAEVPIWITTTQPCNISDEQRQLQRDMADSTFARFGDHAIDIYNGLVDADGGLLAEYDYGDGIHLNNAGHALVYQRVVDAGVWEEILTPVPDGDERVPVSGRPKLYQNVPNPFNPSTRIAFELSHQSAVALTVYDLRGYRIVTLLEGVVPAGFQEVTWTGRDAEGREVPSGVYLSRLETAGQVAHGRMTLVR